MRFATAVITFVVAPAVTLGALSFGETPTGDDGSPAVTFTPREIRKILKLSPLPDPPVDSTNAFVNDPDAARLGQRLYFDTRLSANDAVSCATCHDPGQGFADGRSLAKAIGETTRHTPALWNVAHNRWFFWDGRADTLWSQALGPIENPIEHGASRLLCAHVVFEDMTLRVAYERIFGPMPDLSDPRRFPPDGRPVPEEPDHPHDRAWQSMRPEDREAVDRVFANLGKAIAAYEVKLISRDAPFDRFVEALRAGDTASMSALSPDAQRGLKLFVGKARCLLCHFGPNFTDGEFHSTGVPPLGDGELTDAGRYDGIRKLQASAFNATGAHADRPTDGDEAAAIEAVEKVTSLVRSSESWGLFKTPSLRNVATTAPYMHQGQFATLDHVLRHYSTLEDAVLPGHHREQLLAPINLTDEETADLVSFLHALTGAPADPALLEPPEPAAR